VYIWGTKNTVIKGFFGGRHAVRGGRGEMKGKKHTGHGLGFYHFIVEMAYPNPKKKEGVNQRNHCKKLEYTKWRKHQRGLEPSYILKIKGGREVNCFEWERVGWGSDTKDVTVC